jgi:hypothetical protein
MRARRAKRGFAGVRQAKAADDPAERKITLPGELDMGEVHQLVTSEPAFGLPATGRLMTKIFGPRCWIWLCWWRAWKRFDRREPAGLTAGRRGPVAVLREELLRRP